MDSAGAALLPRFGGYVIEDALGEVLAVCDEADEVDGWLLEARAYFDEACACGHPAAGPWVTQRLPVRSRVITVQEREDIATDGTPWLQREP